ncbi:hypothetical protein A1O3_05013 [Capronia epimyces CBS 606.96]|uniref:Uncharacterized protein n=1 Tax=Capronia epimyces CBS 606.96 TaxID=1182542 RepID=W9Y581_9EURO|nr:uncharacterized protein A1O3_05013 [Capronia epimyces CBS 606.96]EXJ84346.1 hypothetical protein A1O3_05013 [Capronia epimyces CBS 606.96]
MAKSLDDLIQHLLEEIALSGNQGVTINDLAAFTSSFYHEPSGDPPSNPSAAEPLPYHGVAVDPPFLSKIWTWLGRHPDVSIGEDRKYNAISLAEVEHRFPGYLSATTGDNQPTNKVGQDSDQSRQTASPTKPSSTTQHPKPNDGPRIHVNNERVYQAICGHPPDLGKVSAMEFDLLSHIAAARANGILQGDLRQASGQDKRSVPKRTDALEKKGYIIKEVVYRKGNKTSRLVLKKFATDSRENVDPSPRGSTVRDVVRRIFDELFRQNLIPQTKLAEELNLESAAEAAALRRILRRLERLKCVKRVKTATGPSATASDLEQFVQLLHPPGPEELGRFDTEDLALDQPLQELISAAGSADNGDTIAGFSTTDDQEEEAGTARHVARWNPDRSMPNVVVDAVRIMGNTGFTNWDARRMITGVFVRRTMESLLHRISSRSLLAQPPHLRHLAVVRVSIVVDGVAQYIHYSWDVFRQMAERQEVDINQVPGAKEALRTVLPDGLEQRTDAISSKSKINTDEFGFPLQPLLPLQFENGEASFEDIIRTVAAGDFVHRAAEPSIIEKDGVLSLKYRDAIPSQLKVRKSAPGRPKKQLSQPPEAQKGGSPCESADVRIGRPRKYLKGTEKFWRMQFQQARSESGGPSALRKKGLMQDPAGLALYARRPAGFDETLVEAIEAGLPIPATPNEITDAWVAGTRRILSRQSHGVYITPQGVRAEYVKIKSQILILKTPRLQQVDFNDRCKVHPFRFISSMAAHSFAYRTFYPSMAATKQPAQRPTRVSLDKKPRPTSRPRRNSGPAVGVFLEDLVPETPAPCLPEDPSGVSISIDDSMEVTETEPELTHQPKGNGKSLRRASTRSIGSEHVTQNSPLSISEEPRPSQDKPDNLAGHRPETKDRHASSLPEALPEQHVPGQNVAQLSKSTQSRLLDTVHQTGSTSVVTPVASDDQEVIQDISPVEAIDEQRFATTQVDQGSTSLPATVEAEEVVNDLAPVSETALIVEASTIPLRQDSHVAGVTEDQSRRIDTSDVQVQQDQTTDSAPRDVSISEETRQPGQTALLAVDDNVSPVRVGPSRKGIKKRISRAKSQPDDDFSQPSGSEAGGKSRKQQNGGRVKYTPGANALCRKIVLQLISETSGVVPNDPSTLKRISAPRWQEAGAEDRPLLKAVKGAIKALCESGKLRQVVFTFRGKSGIMVKRAVLFLPNISPLSDLVDDVKQKMIDAEPADYIPPEWTAEGARAPLVGKNAQRTLLEADSTPPPTRRRASSAKTDRTVDTGASPSTRSASRSGTRQPSSSPSPPPAVSAATGFLTLKVPSLGSLPVVQIYNWRTQAPVTALRFDTTISTPRKLGSGAAPAPRRGRLKATSRPAGRSVVWAKQQAKDFPSCVEDILQLPDLRIRFEDVQSDDVDWQRFACEVEGVRAWEEQAGESFQSGRTRYAFINHTVPPALYSASVHPSTVDFASLTAFDENGSEVEFPYPVDESWPVFVSALQQSAEEASRIVGRDSEGSPQGPSPVKAKRARRSARPSKRKLEVEDQGGDEEDVFAPRPKRRKAGAKGSRTTRARNRTLGADHDSATKLTRGVQYLRALPAETIYRIAVSVIVVRTLAGGIESYIDWPLVMTNFPDQEEEFIKSRWKTLLNKYRSDIQGLTENLQWKYLGALEAGEVPSVNFQDLKATDWRGIIDWAMRNLDKFNSTQVDELPGTREELLDTHILEFNEPKRSYHLSGYNTQHTNPVKDDVVCSTVFGTDSMVLPSKPTTATPGLHFVPRYEVERSDADLRLARSWVLATILTPESTFNPTLAHAKLSGLAPTPTECEALVTRALRVLQDEKLVQRLAQRALRPSEQVSTVRGWEASRRLFERLEERRMINTSMLRRAVTYKLEVVDAAFEMGESLVIGKDSALDDGDTVAILNLMAMGQIRPRPGADVPDTRYGFDHERVGYKTRNMDKKLINFGVEFAPTQAYVFGDPGRQHDRHLTIPRGNADEPRGFIPLWIDIHGNVQSALWDMCLAGVIGLVVQFPGITAGDLSRALGFALDQTEVELILDWCIQAGFAKMDAWSKGYETTEDWWWCLGAVRDEEGR